ncbi:sporulation protein YtxC [Radiobacillus sp. PE A8.2]|uniref:sporulation protein YtxC n=1 Tax=Radiobacillus sp. PE A8.2 TaxID=3380349 RepID=UPI00388FF023
MLEVNFQLNKEAITFCEQLFVYDREMEFHWKTNEDWGNQIRIEEKQQLQDQHEAIVKALIDVYVSHREIPAILYTIKHHYYFNDKDEIDRILELTESIIAGDDPDLGQIIKNNRPRDTLTTLFEDNMTGNSIHFDSIVNFRLQSYRNQLIEVVGFAIDEFKREEDYQSFVESLREYVSKKESKFPIVHVVQGDDFSFYNSAGKPFSKMEIKMLMQREPLYIMGLDDREMNITPLIAMIPGRICIYGDQADEAKTLTVINVFQEKVIFKPMKEFPFPNYLKSW